jgi:hypothetical protein
MKKSLPNLRTYNQTLFCFTTCCIPMTVHYVSLLILLNIPLLSIFFVCWRLSLDTVHTKRDCTVSSISSLVITFSA